MPINTVSVPIFATLQTVLRLVATLSFMRNGLGAPAPPHLGTLAVSLPLLRLSIGLPNPHSAIRNCLCCPCFLPQVWHNGMHRHSGEPRIGVRGRRRNPVKHMVVHKSCQTSGCRIKSGMTKCIVIPAQAGIQRNNGYTLPITHHRFSTPD